MRLQFSRRQLDETSCILRPSDGERDGRELADDERVVGNNVRRIDSAADCMRTV